MLQAEQAFVKHTPPVIVGAYEPSDIPSERRPSIEPRLRPPAARLDRARKSCGLGLHVIRSAPANPVSPDGTRAGDANLCGAAPGVAAARQSAPDRRRAFGTARPAQGGAGGRRPVVVRGCRYNPGRATRLMARPEVDARLMLPDLITARLAASAIAARPHDRPCRCGCASRAVARRGVVAAGTVKSTRPSAWQQRLNRPAPMPCARPAARRFA